MNDHIIAGRWKRRIGAAATRLGELSSGEWTALGARIDALVGRVREGLGRAREAAGIAADDLDLAAAQAAQQEADRRAEEAMDADYGSGPRLGLANLAATPVADPPPAFARWLLGGARTARLRVLAVARQHPGWALLAAATLGFAVARVVHDRRAA